MFRVLDIYIVQDFSLWFYYFLGVAFNFTMNLANFNINNIVKVDEESGIITIVGNRLSVKAFSNAMIDALHPKLKKVISRRFYDAKGNAKVDIDLTDHGYPKAHPIVPHAHDWIDGKRSEKFLEN